jgi:hypothetical protein
MQTPAIPATLVFGMHEKRPYVSRLPVADGECYNGSVDFDHPAPTGCFDGGNVVRFGDGQRSESVFPNSDANAMHCGDISAMGFPQCCNHVAAT